MEVIKLLGSVLGLSFVAGINLYATVLALGLGIKFGFVHLPPELASLEVLSHPSVLGAAAIAYLMEFVADKIPWVDSFWDSFHTLIRPVGAALLGMAAVGSVDPALQVAVILLCGGIALSSHSTKAVIRLVANHTPEPVTNISLSISEDLLAIFGSWLAVAHPQFMLGLTLSFLVLFALIAPTIFRLLRVEVMALIALIRSPFSTLDTSGHIMFDGIPDRLARHIPDRHSHTDARHEMGLAGTAGGPLHVPDDGPVAARPGPGRDSGHVVLAWRDAGSGAPIARTFDSMDRFDKFTDRARKVLTLAQDEAQRFNHNYIGTEHLLLGLVREGEGVAARVLENMNVELAKVRTAVEFIIGRGDRPVVGEVGLTPRANRVIELAIDEARRLGHNYIGTEHLLLIIRRSGFPLRRR